MTTDPPTTTTEPEDSGSTWASDIIELMSSYPDWTITRVKDDPLAVCCERVRGTQTELIVGTPAVCLRKLDSLPKASGDDTLILRDRGNWISGEQS